MSCIIHERIENLGAGVRRLEERILRYKDESTRLEEALELASHPLDFCVCQDGMCPRCTVSTSQQGHGAGRSHSPSSVMAATPRLEDCTDGLEVCEFLAWSNPSADLTIKLGDAVRACKQAGLYQHLKNNSVRSKLEKYLHKSPVWVFLDDGTFQRLIGPAQVRSTPARGAAPATVAVAA